MKISEKIYQPIDCSFHDLLLAKATLREKVEVQYLSVEGKQLTTNAVITDVFTRNKEEFLILDNDETIRLDRIVSVNAQYFPSSGRGL